jgi:hypothetical protein
MKTKSVFLSVILITVMSIGANAQGFQLGIKGGANFSKISDNGDVQAAMTSQFKFGYSLGGYAILNLNKNIGIQTELLWNEYQTRTTSNADEIYTDLLNDRNISLNYLSIPILLNLSPSKIITFQVGPQFGVLISQSQTLENNAKDAFKKGDLSVLGGVQLNLGFIKLGARYTIGLNNISDISQTNAWKNQGAQAYIGFRIL